MAGMAATVQRTMQAAMTQLAFDGVKLLLGQDQILALEPLLDLDVTGPAPSSVGRIRYLGQHWPVYCLNDKLATLETIPESRKICVLLPTRDGFMGLVCDEVRPHRQEGLVAQSVPACMANRQSPVESLVLYGDEILLQVVTARLAAYIQHSAGPA